MKRLIHNIFFAKGFTLLEVSVVIALISILAAVVTVNYRGSEKRFALQRAAHTVAQDIRKAKEIAMTGEQFYGYFPAGGYGISFSENSSEYVIFADCNGNKVFDGEANNICDDCTAGPEACNPNQHSEHTETLSLSDGISVTDFATIGNTLNIVFFPPDPAVDITPLAGQGNTITIEDDSLNEQKQIIINTAGLIDTE